MFLNLSCLGPVGGSESPRVAARAESSHGLPLPQGFPGTSHCPTQPAWGGLPTTTPPSEPWGYPQPYTLPSLWLLGPGPGWTLLLGFAHLGPTPGRFLLSIYHPLTPAGFRPSHSISSLPLTPQTCHPAATPAASGQFTKVNHDSMGLSPKDTSECPSRLTS